MSREKEFGKAHQALLSISGRRNLTCYDALRHGIDISLEHHPTQLQMKVLEREVALRMDKDLKPSSASRAMSRAALDIWDHGCRRNLEEIYGHPLRERPTAQSIIYTVSDYAASSVSYELVPMHSSRRRHTIVGCDGEQSVAVPVISDDEEKLKQVISTLNARQVPLETFLELFFEGHLPDL